MDFAVDAGGAPGDSVEGGGVLMTVGTPETVAVKSVAGVVLPEDVLASVIVGVVSMAVVVVGGTDVVGATPIVVNTIGASMSNSLASNQKTLF